MPVVSEPHHMISKLSVTESSRTMQAQGHHSAAGSLDLLPIRSHSTQAPTSTAIPRMHGRKKPRKVCGWWGQKPGMVMLPVTAALTRDLHKFRGTAWKRVKPNLKVLLFYGCSSCLYAMCVAGALRSKEGITQTIKDFGCGPSCMWMLELNPGLLPRTAMVVAKPLSQIKN